MGVDVVWMFVEVYRGENVLAGHQFDYLACTSSKQAASSSSWPNAITERDFGCGSTCSLCEPVRGLVRYSPGRNVSVIA